MTSLEIALYVLGGITFFLHIHDASRPLRVIVGVLLWPLFPVTVVVTALYLFVSHETKRRR